MSMNRLFCICLLLVFSFGIIEGQAVAPSSTLQELVNQAAKTTLERFADKKLNENQLSITVIDLREAKHPATASFRGNERVYSASVGKLFYLAAAERWVEEKKIPESAE